MYSSHWICRGRVWGFHSCVSFLFFSYALREMCYSSLNRCRNSPAGCTVGSHAVKNATLYAFGYIQSGQIVCLKCVSWGSPACWFRPIAESNMTSLLFTHRFHMLFLHMEVIHTNHAGSIIFETLKFDEKLEFLELVQQKSHCLSTTDVVYQNHQSNACIKLQIQNL